MMLQKLILNSIVIFFTFFTFSCDTDDSIETDEDPAIESLDCANINFSATATINTSFTATVTVPYSGGNGVAYSAGSAISSTSVEGLTATLAAGTLSSSDGTLTYNITGTPTSSGTAYFAIDFADETCTVGLTVADDGSNGGGGTTTGNVAEILTAIEAFKATLTASQISTLQIDLTKTNAAKWSNLPGGVSRRNGLEFSTLSSTQLSAALKVIELSSGSSANAGYDEFNQIRLADTYLGTRTNGYSETLYIIAILGTPSSSGNWMLQFGGHHYAQNINFSDGSIVSNTPSHQGVEPLSWTASGTTYAPLSGEHAAMLAMLSSLSSSELATAKLSTRFSDVLLGPGNDGQFPATKLGIKASALTTAQKDLIFAAMEQWVGDADDTTAETLMTLYKSEIDETYISYSGNASLSNNADYVRIDGPSVWIELVCQSGVVFSGIHYHTIFRDHNKDYNGL